MEGLSEIKSEVRFVVAGSEIVIPIPPEGFVLQLMHYGSKRKKPNVRTVTDYRLHLAETGIHL